MKLFLLYRGNSKQRETIIPALTSTKEYPVPPGEEQENDNDENDNDDNDDDDHTDDDQSDDDTDDDNDEQGEVTVASTTTTIFFTTSSPPITFLRTTPESAAEDYVENLGANVDEHEEMDIEEILQSITDSPVDSLIPEYSDVTEKLQSIIDSPVDTFITESSDVNGKPKMFQIPYGLLGNSTMNMEFNQ